VKVAQVERAPTGGLRLRQGAVIARQSPWPDHEGVGAPPQSSAQEIVAAINFGDQFSGQRAACTLPMHLYGFRGLHIPPGSLDQRRNMIASELTDAWDEHGEDFEFDFWETEVRGAKLRLDEPNVNVLAVSRRWTHQLAQDSGEGQLQLQVLDGPPLAIARAVQLVSARQGETPHAALDWGFTSTTFCVVHGGRALFTRRFRSCGLRLVCQAIETSLGVSLEETQHLLLSFGLAGGESGQSRHPLQEAMADAAAEPLARLTEEVQRTLAYFSAQRRELTPEKIWFMGGGGAIPGAAAWLAAACGVPVQTWRFSAPPPDSDEAPGDPDHANLPITDEPLLAEAIALSAMGI
jgi:Tfp pilus assembly PilM family ATPase